METKMIDVSLITVNEGQVEGLPRNPRLVRKERYEATKRSIEESPEMLSLRELIAVELWASGYGNNEALVYNDKYLQDIHHIEKMYHVEGGESPDADLVMLIKQYVACLV